MPRILTLILMLLLTNLPSRGDEIPELFSKPPRNTATMGPSFNAATLAMAVNHCVAIGEEASVKELAFRSSEQVGWVCRILFSPKGREPLRPPMYGSLWLPDESMPLKKWPLFPVVHSGRSYFVLSQGYSLGGLPERQADYIDYCRKNGVFRKTPVPVPTRKQAMRDAAALRHSAAWKAIRWGPSPQQSARLRDSFIGDFIQKQADSIPAEKS